MAGKRGFRCDVDDGAPRLLEMRQREVGHVVVMQKIAFKRLDVFLRAAVLESNLVVDAGLVDESVESAEFTNGVVNSGVATFGWTQLGDNDFAAGQLRMQRVGGFNVFVNDDRYCRLSRKGASNGSADSFGASGDENNFVFE